MAETMSETDPNRPTYPFDEDISLFDIWEILWRAKLVIIGITALFVLFSILYLAITEWEYESEILVEFRLPRPNSLSYIVNDMRELFEDSKTYNEWAQPESVLQFSHIDKTADIEGFPYALSAESSAITVAMLKRGKADMFVVRDKDASLIADAKNYADFLNEKLTDENKMKALADLALLDEQIELARQGESVGELAQTRLKLVKFLAEIEAGKKIALIHLPTPPRRVSPKPEVTVIIAALIGGIIGCGVVVVYDAYKTYRRNKATA